MEFYIPQIISYYLRNDLEHEEKEEIELFIVKGCEINVFFAHRVWFFLQASMINREDNDQIEKIIDILSKIEIHLNANNEA